MKRLPEGLAWWARPFLAARLPRTRTGKTPFYGAAGACAAGFVGSLGVAVWSGYPGFCPSRASGSFKESNDKSCHHIRPHYLSWACSTHGNPRKTHEDYQKECARVKRP